MWHREYTFIYDVVRNVCTYVIYDIFWVVLLGVWVRYVFARFVRYVHISSSFSFCTEWIDLILLFFILFFIHLTNSRAYLWNNCMRVITEKVLFFIIWYFWTTIIHQPNPTQSTRFITLLFCVFIFISTKFKLISFRPTACIYSTCSMY